MSIIHFPSIAKSDNIKFWVAEGCPSDDYETEISEASLLRDMIFRWFESRPPATFHVKHLFPIAFIGDRYKFCPDAAAVKEPQA
jgi:hypothetical protein